MSAQKVRLGYSGLRRSLRSMGSLAGIVMLRSLDQAEKTHEAMVARGYRGFLPLPALAGLAAASMGHRLCRRVTLIAAAYFLAERWPL